MSEENPLIGPPEIVHIVESLNALLDIKLDEEQLIEYTGLSILMLTDILRGLTSDEFMLGWLQSAQNSIKEGRAPILTKAIKH